MNQFSIGLSRSQRQWNPDCQACLLLIRGRVDACFRRPSVLGAVGAGTFVASGCPGHSQDYRLDLSVLQVDFIQVIDVRQPRIPQRRGFPQVDLQPGIKKRMLIHWHIDPVLVTLGPITIRWYGLLFVTPFLAGLSFFSRVFREEGIPEVNLERFLLFAGLGTVIGARLAHCFFYDPAYYAANPLEVFAVWEGGGQPWWYRRVGRWVLVGHSGILPARRLAVAT